MKMNFMIKSKNPKINMTNDLLRIMKESFELQIDKKRLKGILKRNEAILDVSNITILFNKFMFNIANINFHNNAKFVTNSVFVTVNKFNIRRSDNKNGYSLLKEKEFKLSYEHPTKNDKILKIDSDEINIMISQDDLYYFISYISSIYFDIKPKTKKPEKKKEINSINKNNKLNIEIKLPKINLFLCKNTNYTKQK